MIFLKNCESIILEAQLSLWTCLSSWKKLVWWMEPTTSLLFLKSPCLSVHLPCQPLLWLSLHSPGTSYCSRWSSAAKTLSPSRCSFLVRLSHEESSSGSSVCELWLPCRSPSWSRFSPNATSSEGWLWGLSRGNCYFELVSCSLDLVLSFQNIHISPSQIFLTVLPNGIFMPLLSKD